MKARFFYTAIFCLSIIAPTAYSKIDRPFYKDLPFIQDFSQILPLIEQGALAGLSWAACAGPDLQAACRYAGKEHGDIPQPVRLFDRQGRPKQCLGGPAAYASQNA
jgi:hypothetical protein